MNEQELRSMVEKLVMDLAGQETLSVPYRASTQVDTGACLPDLTETDLRKQYLIENPQNGAAFLSLKAKTPARLGLGRAGARYKTETMLRMRADHAAAQDSVFSHVPEEWVTAQGYTSIKTLCETKDEYLTRPDRGRRFDSDMQAVIKKTLGNAPQVALVVGDGLSSAAIEANAPNCVSAILAGLKSYGLSAPPILFIKYCRVGASDHIGELTGAQLVCMLVGERPGLVTAESMSAYLTYKPHLGIPESKRTVVSNIHRQGTTAVEAGAHIAELIKQILDKKASGIDLRGGATS